MHVLVALHGQSGWVAALSPLSVDWMIVAASTTLLADSRSGARGGVLPWMLLVIGSVASLSANVAVAEPTVTRRVIAAWPAGGVAMGCGEPGRGRVAAKWQGDRRAVRPSRGWGRLVKRTRYAGEFADVIGSP